jgi:lipid-A-disaccharide synthase-like uncharacterized protein
MGWLNGIVKWVWGLLAELEAWDAVGFVGQFVFFLRFVVQWIATERKKRTVIPVAFWYLSLAGSAITLVYAIHVGRLVFILAFSLNMVIYVRNLYYARRKRRRAAAIAPKAKDEPPAPLP